MKNYLELNKKKCTTYVETLFPIKVTQGVTLLLFDSAEIAFTMCLSTIEKYATNKKLLFITLNESRQTIIDNLNNYDNISHNICIKDDEQIEVEELLDIINESGSHIIIIHFLQLLPGTDKTLSLLANLSKKNKLKILLTAQLKNSDELKLYLNDKRINRIALISNKDSELFLDIFK